MLDGVMCVLSCRDLPRYVVPTPKMGKTLKRTHKGKMTIIINLDLKTSADSLTAYLCFGITARQRKPLLKNSTVHSRGCAKTMLHE